MKKNILWCSAVLLLTACSLTEGDLQQWMDNAQAEAKSKVRQPQMIEFKRVSPLEVEMKILESQFL